MTNSSNSSQDGHIYYVLESKLQPGVFKLGITNNLTRRLNQHGGLDKHRVIKTADLGSGHAYDFEKWVKAKFHKRRITDGNELFALDEKHLATLIKALEDKELEIVEEAAALARLKLDRVRQRQAAAAPAKPVEPAHSEEEEATDEQLQRELARHAEIYQRAAEMIRRNVSDPERRQRYLEVVDEYVASDMAWLKGEGASKSNFEKILQLRSCATSSFARTEVALGAVARFLDSSERPQFCHPSDHAGELKEAFAQEARFAAFIRGRAARLNNPEVERQVGDHVDWVLWATPLRLAIKQELGLPIPDAEACAAWLRRRNSVRLAEPARGMIEAAGGSLDPDPQPAPQPEKRGFFGRLFG